MKQKRDPKRKIEEVYREVQRSAEIALSVWGLAPDTITPQMDGSVEIYFAPKNPQAAHASKTFMNLERDGRVIFRDTLPFSSVLSERGNDLTAWIYINATRLSPSYWQRFKRWIGL